jgi:Flp pilus assembly protein TadG
MTVVWRWVRSRVGSRDRAGAGLVIMAAIAPLLLAGGLIWDASSKLEAARVAQTAAQEAARVGGQRLAPDAILGGTPTVDPDAAAAAARGYLATIGMSGTVTVAGRAVTVTTSRPWQSQFLPGSGTVTGHATVQVASPQRSEDHR